MALGGMTLGESGCDFSGIYATSAKILDSIYHES